MSLSSCRVSRRELLMGGAALVAMPAVAATRPSAEERLDRLYEQSFQRRIDRSPLMQSSLGIKTDQDKWDDISEARQLENADLARRDLAALRAVRIETLAPQARLSYRLFEYNLEEGLRLFEWRRHRYPLSQMRGLQRTIPQTLINNHPIATRDDAEDYISRVQRVQPLLAQLEQQLRAAEGAGIKPPRFVYPMVIGTCENLMHGAPFDASGADSPIFADFKGKVAKLALSESARTRLVEQGATALREGFAKGFGGLITYLRTAEKSATTDDGVWKLPDGEAFYAAMLAAETTLPVTAKELHELGLQEVARIHGEMRQVMKAVGFNDSLQAFFQFLRADSRFYYPSTAAGREQYLAAAEKALGEINARLHEILTRKPAASVTIKPVEPWLEKSAGTAGYFAGSADGQRPGILYFNLYNMANLPRYELPALVFHEGVPGHHVERSLSQELRDIPRFRRHRGYTAFSEGWALYAEQLPKEVGFYRDPYEDFGRLSMDLTRASRLVVDTGIHAFRWSRERAVEYLDANTANSHADNVTSAGRYTVLPGQATAYQVGKLRITALRARAAGKLGARFNAREFHDVVLGQGPVTLGILEQQVDEWVAARPPT